MKKKQLVINLISNIIYFIIQLAIGFLLTPVIIEKTGDAAYGFIRLASNFTSYINIFSVIINSMSSRFITVELSKNNIEKANKYYSSVALINIIMSVLVTIISTVIVINLNNILSIPNGLESDVKTTFSLAFASLIISLLGTVFNIATYAKDRLDIPVIRKIIGSVLNILILIVTFSFLPAKIYFVSCASLVVTVYLFCSNIQIAKKLAPELKFSFKNFDKNSIKTLAKSGIWNFFESASKILLTELDLLIANLFVGPEAMGILSIAKTMPNTIDSLIATISSSFVPQLVILYSKNKIRELIECLRFSVKILGLIMIVPIAGFIAFGTEFFTLWLPFKSPEEIKTIQVLSILLLAPYIISANNNTLWIIDSVTDKLKKPVIVTMVVSIASTITTFVLLKVTNLGIYAIAGVSSIYWCIKVFFFNTVNAAVNLRVKWNTFFKQYLINIGCFLLILFLFYYLKTFMILNSWLSFLSSIFCVGILGYVIVFCVLMKKEEKLKLFAMLKNKFSGK